MRRAQRTSNPIRVQHTWSTTQGCAEIVSGGGEWVEGRDSSKPWCSRARTGSSGCPGGLKYRARFGTETSYRQRVQYLPLTTSADPVYRLLLFGGNLLIRAWWVPGRRTLAHIRRDLILELATTHYRRTPQQHANYDTLCANDQAVAVATPEGCLGHKEQTQPARPCRRERGERVPLVVPVPHRDRAERLPGVTEQLRQRSRASDPIVTGTPAAPMMWSRAARSPRSPSGATAAGTRKRTRQPSDTPPSGRTNPQCPAPCGSAPRASRSRA